jgi:gluconokinase
MDKNPLQPYVIGIDVGTGSAKAIAMDSRGAIFAGSRVSYPTRERLPGYSEQDPEIIWNAFADCINEITGTLPYPPALISLSSAMHGLMVIDQHHKPLTLLQTWSDTRSEKIAERLRRSEDAEKIYRATGTPLHAMSPLCKIIWLKENEPEIYSAAAKFISIKEFIWHTLFGAYQTDWSIASATGLFDLESFGWNSHSLQLCQIHSRQLSEIVSTSFTRKDRDPAIAAMLHIPADTPFCIGASDGCLANVGSFAVARGTAALTIGTSGAVRVASEAPVFNFGAMTFNYVLDEKTFICGGPLNNGGSALDWALKAFSDHPDPSQKDYEEAFSLIETVPPGCRG